MTDIVMYMYRYPAFANLMKYAFILGLLASLAWSLARVTWLVLDKETPVVAAPPIAAPVALPDQAAENIAGASLFGEPSRKADLSQPAPETRLNMVLKGVFVSENADNSSALIAIDNKPEQNFHIGDELPGSGTLAGIFSDHIVLERAGGNESLSFPDAKKPDAAAVGKSGAASPFILLPNPKEEAPDAGTRISEYRDKLAADPEKFLTGNGLEPVSTKAAKGYRLAQKISGSRLSEAGMEVGDVLLSINGYRLGNLEADKAFLQSMPDTDKIRLTIQRGSRKITLQYP